MGISEFLHTLCRQTYRPKDRSRSYKVIRSELNSDEVLDKAYGRLCKRRRDYPAGAEVWSFRQVWTQGKDKLKAALVAGRYRFGLLARVTLKDGEEIDLWSARAPPKFQCATADRMTNHLTEGRRPMMADSLLSPRVTVKKFRVIFRAHPSCCGWFIRIGEPRSG